MQIYNRRRWLCVLVILTCFLSAYAKGGRGGGGRSSSRGSSSRSSYSRPAPAPAYRPAPAPAYRPAPAPAYRPAPAPAYRPAAASRPAPSPAYRPSPAPAYRPSPAPAYRPSPKPATAHSFSFQTPKPFTPPHLDSSKEAVVFKQPAYNPSFKEPDYKQGASSAGRQPASNPNYKPDGSGPPPPYSPSGQPVPNAPVGPPPAYKPPTGVQPPPYPGGQPNIAPPAYPGLQPGYPGNQIGANRPYPVQPGNPGNFQQQPGMNRPYPVQPGYPSNSGQPYPVQPGYPGSNPNQPGVNRPYPVQPGYPGGYPNQPGLNRPYPVQPGYPGGYPNQPGMNRPYPVQPGMNRPLGGSVWQPHQGMPAPAYMNYGGIPTGTNMYTKPHKKKGFIGSLMSSGKPKKPKHHKYYGSYPSPYSVGAMGHTGGGFLGKHNSASMYTIFPYMVARKAPKLFKPRLSFMPFYMPRPYYHGYYHHHHYHDRYEDIDPEYARYYDVYENDYAGKCLRPLKKEHSDIKCKSTFNEIKCDGKCEEGYSFPLKIEQISNKCWHVTGVWSPKKNFPDCKPVCENECMNGGECVRPGVCRCTSEFRGSRCQISYLKCDIRNLSKGENIGWVCHHHKNETACTINCKEPAQFESPPADQYRCTLEGAWIPNTIPHCVIKEKLD